MNLSKLISSAQVAQNVQGVDQRAAVAATPLAVGDIIAFSDDIANVSRIVNVLSTPVRMLYGVRVGAPTDNVTDEAEAVQVSALALGRVARNLATGDVVRPNNVPARDDMPADAPLVFDAIQNMNVGEIPAYIVGKRIQVAGLQRVPAVNAAGLPRLDANGNQIVQVIYRFIDVTPA